MSLLQLKHYRLPHPGLMPGSRGLKKVLIPAGTKVYCIAYGTKLYWCSYLHRSDAERSIQGLEATLTRGHRPLTLETLIAWNFKGSFPKRVFRSNEYKEPAQRRHTDDSEA